MINLNEVLSSFARFSKTHEERLQMVREYGDTHPEMQERIQDKFGNDLLPETQLYFNFITQQGFKGKPEWIKPQDFKADNNQVFYHGFSDYDHAHSFLSEEDRYHVGNGFFGNGLYLTTNPEVAYEHTFMEKYDRRDEDMVLPVKICSTHGAKFSNLSMLAKDGVKGILYENGENPYNIQKAEIEEYNRLVRFIATIEDPDLKQKFTQAVFGDNGETVTTLSAYLGYDYVYNDGRVGGEIRDKQVIVNNRGCLEVNAEQALAIVVSKQLKDIEEKH